MAADWAELRAVVIQFSRTPLQTWQAVLRFSDIYGSFESPPVLAANDQRKADTPARRRERLFSLLDRAASQARMQRVTYICKRKPAAGKVRA